MNRLHTIWRCVQGTVKRRVVKQQIDDELRFHIEQRAEQNMRDGMLVTGFGTILGVGGALIATGVLRAFLFGVTSQDPITFAVAGVLIDVVAMLACWLLARRAVAVDPMVALRYE